MSRILECAVAHGLTAVLIAFPALVPVGGGPHAGRALAAAAEILLQPVASGLTNPTFVTSAGDGSHRLFILEQGGTIKVLRPGATAPTVFLDLRDKVLPGAQQGLAGLAFHPQYSSNRRFFVDYTRRSDAATVIAEYRVSANDPFVADPAETILLVIREPLPNLTGGTLAFGPDGFLYIGVGQAGVGNDPTNTAQDLNQLLGKILRIDVDQAPAGLPYASPPSNPFFGATPGRDEIFAYGLRNPWRFSFDRLTGDLLAGDVGNHAREEINLITRGGNYGWRVREGKACSGNVPELCRAPGFIAPLANYRHTGGRCAVIGGYRYRGTLGSLPRGSYVFGDFCSGEIFLLQDGDMRILLETPLVISSFGEDHAGEVYVVDWLGAVYRIAAAVPVGVSDPVFPGVPGVTLSQGQRVTITASGSACFDAACTTQVGPAGSGRGPGGPTAKKPGAPLHGLVCGVGGDSSGDLFFVGEALTFTAPRSGELYCGMNEPEWEDPWAYGDNSGSWAVTVTPADESCPARALTVPVDVSDAVFPAIPGLVLEQGQRVTITANGLVCFDAACTPAVGPAGSSHGPGGPTAKKPGAPLHGLVCGIGDDSSDDLFFVGWALTVTAPRFGRLFCGMNDADWENPSTYGDNSGSWTVTVACEP